MLRTLVSKLFREKPSSGAPNTPTSPAIETRAHGGSSIEVRVVNQRSTVQYPPQDPGFQLSDASALLEAQGDLLAMLKTHAAVSPLLYQSRFLGPIESLARHIGNLPATSSGVFAGEGGLFRACIELAFYAFRASDGRIFTGSSGVEERHRLEARWRYVCFAAGLLYPLGQPLHGMTVLDQMGKTWAPELDPIDKFVAAGESFWVTWRNPTIEPGPSAAGAMIAHHVLGRANIDWLNEGSPELARRIHEVVTGATGASSLLANTVIRDTWASIHEREIARRHQNYGRLVVGSHISPYVIDSMVMLSRDVWKVNEKVMFCDGKNVYLQWPDAGTAIIEFCKQRGYRGIPASEAALLTMMSGNGLVHGNADGVDITEIADSKGEIVGAVRLSKPGLLIDDMQSVAKKISRPVTVDDVLAADPIASASPESSARDKANRASQSADVIQPAPPSAAALEMPDYSDSELDDGEEEPEGGDQSHPGSLMAEQSDHKLPVVPTGEDAKPASVRPNDPGRPEAHKNAQPAAATSQSKTGLPGSGKPSHQGKESGATKSQADSGNAPKVSYVDGLPASIRERLVPYSAEILGRLVHEVKSTPDDGNLLVRATKIGFAVDHEIVLGISSKAIDALSNWAENGLLYIDPTRPGNKVHQISISEGGQRKRACIVFRATVAEAMGLK